jgi:hypothetical protein
MDRSDWNLLVLSAAAGKPLSPVQLQKVIFLLQRNYPEAVGAGYNFQPYNFGAFDADVYSDAEGLELQGLSKITRSPGGWKEYAATPAGLERAKALEAEADPRAISYMKRVVAWARGLTFQDLVRAVYKAYPDTKANSIFRDQ